MYPQLLDNDGLTDCTFKVNHKEATVFYMLYNLSLSLIFLQCTLYRYVSKILTQQPDLVEDVSAHGSGVGLELSGEKFKEI